MKFFNFNLVRSSLFTITALLLSLSAHAADEEIAAKIESIDNAALVCMVWGDSNGYKVNCAGADIVRVPQSSFTFKDGLTYVSDLLVKKGFSIKGFSHTGKEEHYAIAFSRQPPSSPKKR